MKQQFIKGQWYKSPKWGNFYIKCDEFVDIKGIPTVKTKERYNSSQGGLIQEKQNYSFCLETYTEVPISEIAHLLPKSHPDLLQTSSNLAENIYIW